jgi:hypothetical protein
MHDLQVPLQVGTLFTATAAQHSWESPAMQAAWELMALLLTMATDGSRSLAASVQQQLQQSGMLQPLGVAMTAMAADLQAQAATVAARSWDAAGVDIISQVVSATPHASLLRVFCVQSQVLSLWCYQTHTIGVSWMFDPSGHVVAGLQLITAAMQHVSSVVQHVLPALRQRAPQQADEQSRRLSADLRRLHPPTKTLEILLSEALLVEEGVTPHSSQLQLLLSPHMLPYLVLVVTGHAASIRRALTVCSHGVEETSGSSGSGSSRGISGRSRRQKQGVTHVDSSSSATASVAACAVLTGCQLQLLQQVGFAPDAVAWVWSRSSLADAASGLRRALNICKGCIYAIQDLLQADHTTVIGTNQLGQQQQRWAIEQGLWLLLQTVLVPCACDLMSPSAWVQLQQRQQQGEGEEGEELGAAGLVEQLLRVSRGALHVSKLLGQGLGTPDVRPAGWVQELLGGLVQLAGCLGEQPLAPGAAAAAAPPGPTSSSSSSSRTEVTVRAVCAAHLLALLTAVSQERSVQHESGAVGISEGENSSECAGSIATVAVPLAAAGFVHVAGALEAAMRAFAAGVQGGAAWGSEVHAGVSGRCAELLLQHTSSNTNCLVVQHMGLCGPAALAQEQRQLYSLLSTVLKVGRCESSGGQWWCWRAAASCFLAAAQTSVSLLSLAAPAGPGQIGPIAAAQQPAVEYLPSLVIFGRCCLQWAEQLQQQAEGLILLAAALLQQEREYQDALLYVHSVANVCIPGMRQEAVTLRGERLESLVGMMSGWVGGLESAACLGQLAAAGCSPQQLQQQLDALLAAQPRTLQELTEASLAALVQQLQVTGRMLCSIAVPHFCNNLVCGNISGPTEVRLVSGRSCLCAGCLTARYCGRDCQRAAWKQHKPVCKALAAAAAAAAVAEAAQVG